VSASPSVLVCAGCGTRVGSEAGGVWSCPRAVAGDDVDHVLRRVLNPAAVAWPQGAEGNPFLRYRTLLHAWHMARAGGLTDETYVELVARLDRAIEDVDGRGFRTTPFTPQDDLAARLHMGAGRLLVKNEAVNVSGSHKARHLMGVMLALAANEAAAAGRGGLDDEGAGARHASPPATLSAAVTPGRTGGTGHLAIASCGNAALAAAVVARAAGKPLDVHVPAWAHPAVRDRLHGLGARLVVCERQAGVAGDPCYRAFRKAVEAGAVPFCCQGPDNGLTIEGGATLAWEMIDAVGERTIDRLFVQVGGGALASGCVQGFTEALRLGRIARLPRLHAVQTRGGFPLVRAYERVAACILARLDTPAHVTAPTYPLVADRLSAAGRTIVLDELRHAARHRSAFMWPWESEPRSVATGILDDETYDWLAVVEGMLLSGGYPVVVEEETLHDAFRLAHDTTTVDVCHTGAAGLAGLMTALPRDAALRHDTVAVIFSGSRR
jgi:threonine synthase